MTSEPSASTHAVVPSGTHTVVSEPSMSAGPTSVCPGASASPSCTETARTPSAPRARRTARVPATGAAVPLATGGVEPFPSAARVVRPTPTARSDTISIGVPSTIEPRPNRFAYSSRKSSTS